jgi:hypothetical protein
MGVQVASCIHSNPPAASPLYGEAALADELRTSMSAELDDVLDGEAPVERRSEPIVAALMRLAADDSLLTPEAVLTLDMDSLGDVQLGLLRLALFESGARRMRLAGVLGAVLGLRAVDATMTTTTTNPEAMR